MFYKQMRYLAIIAVIIGILAVNGLSKVKKISFKDDFEKGLEKWDIGFPGKVRIADSGDAAHGKVLAFHPGGPAVYALIKGSGNWTNIKIEGDVFFPTDIIHYMGLVYNYNLSGIRADFGSILVYGSLGNTLPYFVPNAKELKLSPGNPNVNVIAAAPHRDGMAAGLLYPEYSVPLTGESALKTGEWHHFKGEIIGPACHFYVDDMKTPKVTFDLCDFSSGRVGFKGKYVGAEYWLDNIKVKSIKGFAYKGPALPAGITYKPGKLITKWNVIGPFYGRVDDIENDGYTPGKTYRYYGKEYKWQPFKTDPRGCVVSGKFLGKFDLKIFAYFHTEIYSESKKKVVLKFVGANNMELTLNGTLVGLRRGRFNVWYDFWENPAHKGQEIEVTLRPGANHLVIFLRTGISQGDGFFAHWDLGEKN